MLSVDELKENTIAGIQEEIAQAKKGLERFHALQRLQENEDFKLLVIEGLCEKELNDLVLMRTNGQVRPDAHARILAGIDGISWLKNFFSEINNAGHNLVKTLQERQEAINEIEKGEHDAQFEAEFLELQE